MDLKNMKVNQIKEVIKNLSYSEYDQAIIDLFSDSRATVQKLGISVENKKAKYLAEIERVRILKEAEKNLWMNGYENIAGLDEVGRGPLAGPVVTCAIVMPKESEILYVNDSKKLSKKKREELNKIILNECSSCAIGISDEKVIDSINILNATKKAMCDSVEKLKLKPDLLLLDALTLNLDIPQKGIIKGDENIYSIACASIVAKVYRDELMEKYHEIYPEYGFDKNMGYGTAAHVEAIKKYGPTPIHRRSFIKNFL